jgi:hypothetical protein
MPQSYLIFDFAGNEDAAQQARHRVDGWKQAFRLGRKLELRFERPEAPAGEKDAGPAPATEKKAEAAKEKGGAKAPPRLRLLIRLDFSDHEKLSHTRWLERIPAEAPFKGVSHEVVRARDAKYAETEALFDSLAEPAHGPARR